MAIYMPHMNSLASTLWPVVLYIDDNDANTDGDNNDDKAAQWTELVTGQISPLGYIMLM